MLITAPVLGHRSVPVFVKLILASVITLAAAPLIVVQPETIDSGKSLELTDLVSALFAEALVGALLGFGVLIVFSAAQMIGVAIGQMAGLQLDASGDPDTSTGQLPVERLVGFVAIAMFVIVGGPELLLGSILESFSRLPVGATLQSQSVLKLITGLLAQSFELTVLAMAPAAASLLVSSIVVGILIRALPQLNLIQLGLSSNIALMLLALFLTLGGCLWMMVDEIQMTIARFADLLETQSVKR